MRKLSINVRLSDADQMCIHTLSVLIHGLSQEGKFSWNSQSNKSSTIGTLVVHCNALVEDILLREFQGNLKHNFLELSEQYIYPLLPAQEMEFHRKRYQQRKHCTIPFLLLKGTWDKNLHNSWIEMVIHATGDPTLSCPHPGHCVFHKIS